jgi:hypothetical protein
MMIMFHLALETTVFVSGNIDSRYSRDHEMHIDGNNLNLDTI